MYIFVKENISFTNFVNSFFRRHPKLPIKCKLWYFVCISLRHTGLCQLVGISFRKVLIFSSLDSKVARAITKWGAIEKIQYWYCNIWAPIIFSSVVHILKIINQYFLHKIIPPSFSTSIILKYFCFCHFFLNPFWVLSTV